MKSLFERALARPYHSTALLVAIIAAVALLWWLFCPQALTSTKTSTATKAVTTAPVAQPAAQQSDLKAAASETTATTTVTPATVTAANAALPTDPALAEEELDRLNDEHTRLKDRKAQLAQQLEISNKLLAMKEQQLKTLETQNH